MSRSLKKPPFVHYKLAMRVDAAQESGSKNVIKTWSRASTITPDFQECQEWQAVIFQFKIH
jgi:small subunit ribosomal protein S19